MTKTHLPDFSKRVLVLNRPADLSRNNLYMSFCKIPEVLSRLCQYRELLVENEMDIPLWVYCLTQDSGAVKEPPRPDILNWTVNLGLFDRYISRQGWPDYIIGSRPLISAVAGEESFEGLSLLLTHGCKWNEEELALCKVHSYYNTKTETSSLTRLKKMNVSPLFGKILNSLFQDESENSLVFHLLSPNEHNLKAQMESLHLTVRDFLEEDTGLKWLWPLWKRAQLASIKGGVSRKTAH